MTIQIIYGKPGSGKSYHAVKTVVEILCDWARVEKKKGRRHVQRLYTNLPLNRDAVKTYVEKHVPDFFFDVDYYLVLLDDSFFRAPERKVDTQGRLEVKDGKPVMSYWWDDLLDDLLIVIDEVHRYLGSEYAYVNPIESTAALRTYMSMHRHHRHDWILLTQDKGQINRQILLMSERALHVFNAKSMSLPFPISIPMEDVETMLKGFGVKRQLYRVRIGTFTSSSRVTYDGPVKAYVMTQEIFSLYKSNTKAAENVDIIGDRALPFEGKIGAILWFAKKHVPHLTLKAGAVVFLYFALRDVIFELPQRMAMSGSKTVEKNGLSFSTDYKKNAEKTSALPQEILPESPIILQEEIAPEALPTDDLAPHSDPVLHSENLLKPSTPTFMVQAFFTDRIISSTGAYKTGELVEIARFGESDNDADVIKERLERINVKRREILFEGGRIWSRRGFEPPIAPPEPVENVDVNDGGDGSAIRDGLPVDVVLQSGSETGTDGVRDVANEAN